MFVNKREARTFVLLLPLLGLFSLTMVLPILILVRVSLYDSAPGAPLTGGIEWGAYLALFDGYLVGLFFRTLRIAVLTTLGSIFLAFPIAWSLARSAGRWRRVQFFLIVSPLFLSVVVRAYGWLLLVGHQGLLNTLSDGVGLGRPVRMLNTEWGVIVAMIESMVPFMVLSLAPSLASIDSELLDAARGLGCSSRELFRHLILPLSIPGLSAGASLVFLVSMGAYATPALIGGARNRVLVSEIYTQVTAVFDWPFAAALSMALLVFCTLSSLAIARLSERLTPWFPSKTSQII